MYKVISHRKINNSNMDSHKRKAKLIVIGAILGGIFFTLFIDTVWASIDWNLTEITIETGAPCTIKIVDVAPNYYFHNDSWFVVFWDKIAKFDDDFSIQEDGWDNVKMANADTSDFISCSAVTSSYSECLVREQDINGGTITDLDYIKVDHSALAQTTIKDCTEQDGAEYQVDWIHYSSSNQAIWEKASEGNVVWYSNAFKYACFPNGNGSLSIPSAYTDVSESIIYEGSSGKLYLIFKSGYTDGRTRIYYTIYNGDFSYFDNGGLLSLADAYNYSNPAVIRTPSNEWFLTYARNDTNRTIYIDRLAENPATFKLDFLERETIVPPNVFNDADNTGNYTRNPMIRRDDNKLWLFYQVFNDSEGGLGCYGIYENVSCETESWINQSLSFCSGAYRLQKRIVNPSGCTDEENWVWDQDCYIRTVGGAEPEDYQQTERFCEVQTCNSGWLKPWGEAKASCTALLTVNENCNDNMYSNATLTTNVNYGLGLFDSLGSARYFLLMCNSLETDDCFDENPLCSEQWNRTQTLSNVDIYPEEDISAYFEMSNVQQCSRRTWLGSWTGWHDYQVSGTLRYCCNRLCGGFKCVSRGDHEYKVEQYNDCGLNESSKILCPLGCTEGVCNADLPEEDVIRQPSGDPFSWVIGEMAFNFPSFILNALAIGISIFVGVSAVQVTKSMEIGLASIMGLVGLFLYMGWLPMIIGILWIFTLVVMLANLIKKGVKT